MISDFLQVNIVDGAFFPLFSPEPCHIILKRRSMYGVMAKLAFCDVTSRLLMSHKKDARLKMS